MPLPKKRSRTAKKRESGKRNGNCEQISIQATANRVSSIETDASYSPSELEDLDSSFEENEDFTHPSIDRSDHLSSAVAEAEIWNDTPQILEVLDEGIPLNPMHTQEKQIVWPIFRKPVAPRTKVCGTSEYLTCPDNPQRPSNIPLERPPPKRRNITASAPIKGQSSGNSRWTQWRKAKLAEGCSTLESHFVSCCFYPLKEAHLFQNPSRRSIAPSPDPIDTPSDTQIPSSPEQSEPVLLDDNDNTDESPILSAPDPPETPGLLEDQVNLQPLPSESHFQVYPRTVDIDPLPPAGFEVAKPGRREAVLKTLERILANDRKSKSLTDKERDRIADIANFVTLSDVLRQNGETRPDTVASIQIAHCKIAIGNNEKLVSKGQWFARRLREMANEVFTADSLPPSTQGKGATKHSLLERQDVIHRVERGLKNVEKGKVCQKFVVGWQRRMANVEPDRPTCA
jgi:hypothetical protein